MNNIYKSIGLGATTCLLAAFISLGSAHSALAQTPPTTVNSTVESDLQTAYRLLSISDRDYKGYRVKAMREIKQAAEILGVVVTDEPFKHEKQSVSDANLTEAQGLLQGLTNTGDLSGNAMNDVITAAEDLTFALLTK